MADIILDLTFYGVPGFLASLIFVLFETGWGRHDEAVRESCSPAPKSLPKWVAYDPDYAAIGAIEPVFTEEIVGYYNERLLIEDDDIVAVHYWDREQPVYLKTRREAIDPIPRTKTELRWKPVQ